ncbi:hypothetical protein PAHAL_2G236100 [Panicum hallii]|uniref:Ubiquitin-like protease family profile domain-containing protein n=1 Tax=Panicum hallii TaxID=206008 RepID=A0A2T8KQ45_9POAL|nr:hypothetical protein PAHAL_2G236100 [Panicum hallii]
MSRPRYGIHAVTLWFMMSSGPDSVQQAAGGEDSVQQPTDDRASSGRPARSQSGASTSGAGRKKRSQTTWPSDVKSCGRLNSEAAPEDPSILVRLARVCGLTARQRVPLTLEHFDDLSWDDKKRIFKNNIQPYVEYPIELHDKATKHAMKIISKAWRSYKNKLLKCWKKKENPFDKYADLTKEAWDELVQKWNTPEFQQSSEYFRGLRARNELDHHLGSAGYAGKQRKWEQEDEMLAERGIENPYESSKLTEDGNINYYSTSAEEVAQRALMESSQGSNEGVREFDALTRALGTREQRGHVRGVSSQLTWKEGFPEHKGRYRKRTRDSSSKVDIDEIKRQVKMEMFGELKTIFESQGLPFPDLPGSTMSEERSDRVASTAAGASQGRGTERAIVPISVEPDTIDGLARPTRCSLLVQLQLVGDSSRLEVRADCAVVKIDLIHEFAKNIKLEFPPDDTTTTLRDAVARRVQWRRAGIHIDPADADSVPTSQPQPQSPAVPPTFSEPCPQLPDTWEALPDPHPPVPTQPQITPPPPVPIEPATAHKKPSKANPVRKKQSRLMAAKREISEGKKKVDRIKQPVTRAYTSENPKYRVGKSLLSVPELRAAGQYCVELHNYYMSKVNQAEEIMVSYEERHFLQLEGSRNIFIVAWSDLFDLFNLDALDLSLIRCFALHMQQETRRRTGKKCGYIDPQMMTVTFMNSDRDSLVRYMVKCMGVHADKEHIVVPYNLGDHWVTLIINVRSKQVFYLDSSIPSDESGAPQIRDYSLVISILDESLDRHLRASEGYKEQRQVAFTHHTAWTCTRQPSGNSCGFYVCHNMLLVAEKPDFMDEDDYFNRTTLGNVQDIRERPAGFLMMEVINKKGEFHF